MWVRWAGLKMRRSKGEIVFLVSKHHFEPHSKCSTLALLALNAFFCDTIWNNPVESLIAKPFLIFLWVLFCYKQITVHPCTQGPVISVLSLAVMQWKGGVADCNSKCHLKENVKRHFQVFSKWRNCVVQKLITFAVPLIKPCIVKVPAALQRGGLLQLYNEFFKSKTCPSCLQLQKCISKYSIETAL